MLNKEKRKEKENQLLSDVYDLILDTETYDNERTILLEFKTAVENGKDFEDRLMVLSNSLRELAVEKLNKRETLSKKVSQFYMGISNTGLLKKNLGAGMTNLGFLG
ncbi:bacteriocin immunity protein [Leuconostoc suionicum]|uniref:bacteriocin immunity protein n=1 Tax=Leuconostoc suionicum TaxID=1511761 RepID=UPI0032DFF19E